MDQKCLEAEKSSSKRHVHPLHVLLDTEAPSEEPLASSSSPGWAPALLDVRSPTLPDSNQSSILTDSELFSVRKACGCRFRRLQGRIRGRHQRTLPLHSRRPYFHPHELPRGRYLPQNIHLTKQVCRFPPEPDMAGLSKFL